MIKEKYEAFEAEIVLLNMEQVRMGIGLKSTSEGDDIWEEWEDEED